MSGLLSNSLILPALVLAVVAWFVPVVLSRMLAEGVAPLMLNAGLSTLILFGISAGFFAFLYVGQGASVEALAEGGLLSNVVHFGRLGLQAALIWAPIMVLSLANRPRHWTEVEW